jgi:hypothetical protein
LTRGRRPCAWGLPASLPSKPSSPAAWRDVSRASRWRQRGTALFGHRAPRAPCHGDRRSAGELLRRRHVLLTCSQRLALPALALHALAHTPWPCTPWPARPRRLAPLQSAGTVMPAEPPPRHYGWPRQRRSLLGLGGCRGACARPQPGVVACCQCSFTEAESWRGPKFPSCRRQRAPANSGRAGSIPLPLGFCAASAAKQ